jgi:hypothetical protein
MKGAARIAICMQITFLTIKRLIVVAALEYAVDPNQKLFPRHYEAPRACKIERLFKPAAFSVQASPTPPPKRRRLNMNISPGDSQVTYNRTPPSGRGQSSRGYRRGGSYASGRGNYNKDYLSPGGFQIFSNPCHESQASANVANSEFSRNDRTSSSNHSVVIKP